MADPNFVILYVENPAASAAFYSRLLDRTPFNANPDFVMFQIDGGLTLGLEAKHQVSPMPAGFGTGGELVFTVAGRAELDRLLEDWRGKGVNIVEEPVTQPFGTTFLALDPDGHRLRPFARPQPPSGN